jgi:hypothetical protein
MRNEVIASLLVVAILAGVGAGYLVGNENQRTVTSTFTAVPTTTTTVSTTGNSSSSLLAQCSHAEASVPTGLLLSAVDVGTSTPTVICVQFYYFNSTTATTLPTSIKIEAAQPNRSFGGDSNFTVSASENQLVFGGPESEDEGAVVAFAVTAKPGTSGTYELGFSGNYMLAPSEPAECAYYGTLVAGNGHPLYVFPGGCVSYVVSGTATGNLPSIPGIQYPVLTNTLYFRVVGVINSTG